MPRDVLMAARYASLGWDLVHPKLVSLDALDPSAWPEADVVFLGSDVWSRCWQRAVGHPVRAFRTPDWETTAWRQALHWIDRLSQHVQSGRWLVVRLECPSSRCRVAARPGDPRFPIGSPVSSLELLAAMHPVLGAWWRTAGALARTEVELVPTSHPLGEYLDEFRAELRPEVAWVAELTPSQEPLAVTPVGELIACRGPSLAVVPPLLGVDPEIEARVLLATVEAWRAREGVAASLVVPARERRLSSLVRP